MKPNKNVIIACTGSVATIKLPALIKSLQDDELPIHFNLKVIVTECAKHFLDLNELSVPILDDSVEWKIWQKRGDPVLHIDLGKWADMLIISPLDANSLGKVAAGICDNLLLCTIRAWDLKKPLLFCPSMNTRMYEHPLTREQIDKIKSWGYEEIPCISKTLMCGDTGDGAMAEVETIVQTVVNKLYVNKT